MFGQPQAVLPPASPALPPATTPHVGWNPALPPPAGWQTIARRILVDIQPAWYPVIIHGIPESVPILELIKFFSSFGPLADMRYAWTEESQGVAAGLFQHPTAVNNITERLRQMSTVPPAATDSGRKRKPVGELEPPPASKPRPAEPEPSAAPALSPAAPPKPPAEPASAPRTPATPLAEPDQAESWLKIQLDSRFFYWRAKTKTYSAVPPDSATASVQVVSWTADPARFDKALRRAQSESNVQPDTAAPSQPQPQPQPEHQPQPQPQLDRVASLSPTSAQAVASAAFSAATAASLPAPVAGRKPTEPEPEPNPSSPVGPEPPARPSAVHAPRGPAHPAFPPELGSIDIGCAVALAKDTSVRGVVVGKANGFIEIELSDGSGTKKFRRAGLTLCEDLPAAAQTNTGHVHPPQGAEGGAEEDEERARRREQKRERRRAREAEKAACYRGFRRAPIFTPTAEEFASPIEYIRNVVMPAAGGLGLACIRPPPHAAEAERAREALMTHLARPFRYRTQLRRVHSPLLCFSAV